MCKFLSVCFKSVNGNFRHQRKRRNDDTIYSCAVNYIINIEINDHTHDYTMNLFELHPKSILSFSYITCFKPVV